jgi:response regulator NasT
MARMRRRGLPADFAPRQAQGLISDTLAILVVDDNRIRASIIEDGLREAGHTNVQVVTEITEVAARIVEMSPDVVIIDLENPNRDMLEHFFALSRSLERPIAMFVDRADPASIEAAVDAGVSAYVVDGMRKARIKPIMDMAISRFRAFSRLRRELAEAKSELENRKAIDRAKSILMKSRGVSEEEAYALLRTTAMSQNRKISEVAQSLILAAGLLGP